MLYLRESAAARLISLDEAIEVVESAFAAIADGSARTFPVASAEGLDSSERWAVKSGYDRKAATIGFKVGSNWPGNHGKGLPTHGSTVALLDPLTGFTSAVIGAAHLTVLRTAAADAVAVKHLARPDAQILAVLGAGHQAFWNAKAVAQVRTLTEIRVANRNPARAEEMAAALRGEGLPAQAMSAELAIRGADLMTTATTAKEPLFEAHWVNPGTHISAMGADSFGKQELPVPLLERALLFCDIPEQSVTIGEFQNLSKASLKVVPPITRIGDVINAARPGRTALDEITIFDSSGMAIQDLAICRAALEKAQRQGTAQILEE